VKHLEDASFMYAPALPTKLERPARGKHSTLLQTLVSYGRKKFYKICPWRPGVAGPKFNLVSIL
jgi:hypothetical protein